MADKQKKGRPQRTGLVIEPSSPQYCPILACVLLIFFNSQTNRFVFPWTHPTQISAFIKCFGGFYSLFIHNRLIATSLTFSMYFSVPRPIWSSFCRKTNKIFSFFFGQKHDWSLVVLREVLPSPRSFYVGNKCIHHCEVRGKPHFYSFSVILLWCPGNSSVINKSLKCCDTFSHWANV